MPDRHQAVTGTPPKVRSPAEGTELAAPEAFFPNPHHRQSRDIETSSRRCFTNYLTFKIPKASDTREV